MSYKLILLLFSFLISHFLAAQQNVDFARRWVVGYEPGWYYIRIQEPYPSEKEYKLLLLESYINVGYYFKKQFLFGIKGGYSFKASGNMADFPDSYWAGYNLRYYPLKDEMKGTKESIICDKCVTYRIKPYLQIGHYFSNNQVRNGKNVDLGYLGVQHLSFVVGLGLRLRRNLFYNFGIERRYSFNTDIKGRVGGIAALDYYFGYNGKKENQNRFECNSTIAGGLLSCIGSKYRKKEPGPNGLVVGSSLTYISSNLLSGIDGKYREYSWSINAVKFLSRRFRAGINTIQIFTDSPTTNNKRYFLAGGIGQYEPFLGKKHSFLLETGLMYGNYCTCEPAYPRKKDGLIYLDLGFSYELHLTKRLYLDLGLNVYEIMNSVKGKYSYTQYIAGLNYFIGKP